MTDDDALARLRKLDRIETTYSGLAREWGWDRMKVSRRLLKWQNDGLLTCSPSDDGRRVVITMLSSSPKAAQPPAQSPADHVAHSIEEEPKKPEFSSVEQVVSSIEQGLERVRDRAGDPPSEPALLSSLMSNSEQPIEHPVISLRKRDQTKSNVVSFPSRTQGNLAEKLQIDDVKVTYSKPSTSSEPPPVAPVAVQPERRRGPVTLFFVGVFGAGGAVMLSVAIAQAVQLAVEKANGDQVAAWSFGTALVTAGIIGAAALAAREYLSGAWRWACPLVALACIGLTTAYAVGFASHKFETTAADKGHDAAAFKTLSNRVERLKRDVAALGEPRTLEVVRAALKAVQRLPECQKKPTKGAVTECVNQARDALKAEEAAALSLPALKTELAAKEDEWLKAKPVTSADPSSAGLADAINWLWPTGEVATEKGARRGLSLYTAAICEVLAALCFALMTAIWRRG